MHLPALKSSTGAFSILELDGVYQLIQDLDLNINLEGGKQQLERVLRALIINLAKYPAAVAADPVYSFPLLMNDIEKGLVLRLDAANREIIPESLPSLALNWGVDEVANNYAVAKLELWYHPIETAALNKKRMVAELAEYCRHVGIDMILKLNIYTQPDEVDNPTVIQEVQLQSIQELRDNCQLMAIQYPGEALAAATISAELDHPWVVSLSSEDHEINKQQLRTALENGAQGFMIGSALWPEIASFRNQDASLDLEAIENYIKTLVRDRMIELVRITDEFELKAV